MTGIDDPESFYDDYGREEWDRLERSLHGRLEWEATVEQLREGLPETGHLLDAGGGAGRYTVWLAEAGYDVTMIDLSDRQRAIAREKVRERGLTDRVQIQPGDIRDLPFEAGAFDATLCLGGPVSHLLDAAERERAAGELRRVTASDAPVFVSVMGRLNFLQLLLIDGKHLDYLDELAETGDYDADLIERMGHDSAFTETHFFRAGEFERVLEAAGLAVEWLVGLEGLASVYTADPLRETADGLDEDERVGVRSLIDHLRDDRTVADVSAHILAVCRSG